MANDYSLTHVDTCLSCYVQDHCNGDNELLLGVPVDRNTRAWQLRAALLDGLFHPRTDATGKMIREAQKSGRLRKDLPAHVAVDLLVGPLFYRMFVRHQPLNDAFVSQVFRSVMRGLEAKS